jgi:uncharacterized SAM-binding protein YcdF (DUF218 family)
LLLLVAILGARVFSTQILVMSARLLIENDGGPRKADAIVVLGGDTYGDRTLKGAELAKAGYAPFVIVSGPPRLIGYESTDEIQFAEQHGYAASLFREVHLPGNAESTRTEGQFLGEYLEGQGVKSILLVTSNYHTRRAAKLWRKENPKLAVTVVPSADPGRYFRAESWWKTRQGQKMFVNEWLKTIAVMFGV